MSEHGFVVEGEQKIHCESCEQRIARALSRVAGVQKVRADHRTQEIRVSTDGTLSGDEIRQRLARIGYEVGPKGA